MHFQNYLNRDSKQVINNAIVYNKNIKSYKIKQMNIYYLQIITKDKWKNN